jgi:LytS/YehU family sensor histidine kinase
MEQDSFLELLDALLIHAHQLCSLEDAKQSSDFLQQTEAVLRYYSKPQKTVLLSKEIDILRKYVHVYTIIENRVQDIDIKIDERIDQRNIFVKRFILIDWTEAFIQNCISSRDQVAKISINLSSSQNTVKYDLSSSTGCTGTNEIII